MVHIALLELARSLLMSHRVTIISLTLPICVTGLDCIKGAKEHHRPSHSTALVFDDILRILRKQSGNFIICDNPFTYVL